MIVDSQRKVNEKIRTLSKIQSFIPISLILLENTIIISIIILNIKYLPSFWLIPSSVIIATRMYALYSMAHEAVHFSISRNKLLNDIVAQIFIGIPIFINIKKLRKVHLLHHKHLLTSLDPEKKQLNYIEFQFPMNKYKLLTIIFFDIIGINYIRYKFKNYKSILLLASFAIVILFLLYNQNFDVLKFIFLWIFPYISVYQLLNRIRLLTEHYYFFEDNSSNTRSIQSSSLEFLVFSPYNINYHLEHHLYPSVPFYNLPKLSKYLEYLKIFDKSLTHESSYYSMIKNFFKYYVR